MALAALAACSDSDDVDIGDSGSDAAAAEMVNLDDNKMVKASVRDYGLKMPSAVEFADARDNVMLRAGASGEPARSAGDTGPVPLKLLADQQQFESRDADEPVHYRRTSKEDLSQGTEYSVVASSNFASGGVSPGHVFARFTAGSKTVAKDDGGSDSGDADNPGSDTGNAGNNGTDNGNSNNTGTGTGDSGNGDSGNGDSGNGDSGNGDSGNGDSGNGDSGSGDSGSGDAGNGDSGDLGADGSDNDDTGAGNVDAGGSTATTYTIEPGDNAMNKAQKAFNAASIGDTIEFACGFYDMTSSLQIRNTEGVTVKGCGMDKTVLSFRNSSDAEGLALSNDRGVTVADLTVVDTPGDGIKIKSSDIVTYRNVRAMWSSANNTVTADNYRDAIDYKCPTATSSAAYTYEPSKNSGRYGIYPVQTSNVLLDNVESLGASDAGIYVGQTDDVIIKNSRALYNVAGFEFENTQRADMNNNVAECNTVGYIIYDLPYLTQYGYQARLRNSTARNNNLRNFSKGGIVSKVPPGSGMITLAFDQVEVVDNTFVDNKTGGIIITSYKLLGDDGDTQQDIYTEALNIHRNEFNHNGFDIAQPTQKDLSETTLTNTAPLFPVLIKVKNAGYGADILWDGLYDKPDSECAYPTNADGERLPHNDRGKPLFEGSDVKPDCRYNQYKFDEAGNRKKPSMYICIANNTHRGSPNAPDFANFHGQDGLVPVVVGVGFDNLAKYVTNETLLEKLGQNPDIDLDNLAASNDLTPHRCQQQYNASLPSIDDVQLASYTPPNSSGNDRSPAEVAAICEGDAADDGINQKALNQVDCPTLASYRLFANAEDPQANPNGRGVRYELNTKLFADYAVKYRFVFMPPGTAAQYRDRSDGINKTYKFPVGTAIAKTFSFKHADGSIRNVETRLLIKRKNDGDNMAHWIGLPYVWHQANGKRVATLTPAGATAQVQWHYSKKSNGDLLQGSTDNYHIPSKNQCIECHRNTYRTAGSAPIGPKPRNLNRPFGYAVGKRNQIAYWADNGLLEGAPALDVDPNTLIANNVERIPHFNVPGDSGFAAGSDKDVEARVRGYLEVNCAHCHNKGGESSNTGLYLDTLRKVDAHYGICKPPTAAGNGTGDRNFDIHPGMVSDSILPYRMGSNEPAAQMPPIARSVVHQQALELVADWINNTVDGTYANADACSG